MDDAVITDVALAARDGDQVAAARFVELTEQEVWRLLTRVAGHAVSADLVQETYGRAFGSLPHFRAESPARTWLLAIARRVAADDLRRRLRRPGGPRPPVVGDEPPGTAGPADLAEAIALRLAVDALPAERREAFVLTQVLGLSYAEAAWVARCPVGTIRSRVARARTDLVTAISVGESRR